MRAKWRSSLSAYSSALKKFLTRADIVREAWLRQPFAKIRIVRNIPARLLACFLVLTLQPAFSRENNQTSYEAARLQASEAVDLFSAGPVQIHSSFHLHVLAGQLDGTYQYSQLSRDEFREDIQIPAFNESIVSRSGERYVSRSKELEPLPIWYVRELIYFAHMIPAGARVSTATTSALNGQNVKCYASEKGLLLEFPGYKACFDMETGLLAALELSFNTSVHRFEYSRFLRNGKKFFPGTMRRFHNGELLAEVDVDSIGNTSMDVKLFDPPAAALKQGGCKHFQPAEIDYTKEYFQIRSEHPSGSVIVAASLDDRGKVVETEIQQSSGRKMDEAALRALKEVRIHPAKCDGHTVPSFFRLQIWFSPALHPDSFESFR
jgi:TonB family protein